MYLTVSLRPDPLGELKLSPRGMSRRGMSRRGNVQEGESSGMSVGMSYASHL